MGMFKFPAALSEELSQIIRNFLWGDEEDKSKTHRLAWDQLTSPKAEGEMGFRDLKLFNQALLAKQAWRLVVNPDSLCAKAVKAKYYPQGLILDIVFPLSASLPWQALMHGLELLKLGVIWVVRDGSNINIWRDNWLPRHSGLKITARKSRTRMKWVSDLILTGPKGWDENLVRHLFYPHDAEETLQLRIPSSGEGDFVAWRFEKTGMFSVKSAYKHALTLKEQKEDEGQYRDATLGERKIWDIIWKANVPQKIHIFAWRVATNSLAVQVNRMAHHQAVLSTCSICGVEDENMFHALIICPKAHALRMAMRDIWELPTEDAFRYTESEWFLVLLSPVGQSVRDKIIFIFWRAWHLRNDLIFWQGHRVSHKFDQFC